jgi:DNA mismatch repair ATPase MutS
LFETNHPEANKKDVLRMILELSDSEVEKAVGALTYHLLQAKLIDRRFKLENIIWNNFDEGVSVSHTTYDYLDLAREQMHPCKGIQGRGKEGFTIFNIYLMFTLTDMGRRLLSDIFMNPTYNRQILEDRYDTIHFMHQRLFEHEKLLNKYLRRIYNVTAILNEFELIKSKP